ncbi:DUF2786 domain-containing protein [Ammonicoccus fulvus]|uniref:DUF2786 domain-containing protein n=1 Tax=Ammonicoccus fulvus TaxID=3138240 RepID=A0ABZ3FND3_9ACTN
MTLNDSRDARSRADDAAAACREAVWISSADIAPTTVARLFDQADRRWRAAAAQWLDESLRSAQKTAWRRGWQPADVHRLARRKSALAARLSQEVMAFELGGYARATVDRTFWDQLGELERDRNAGRSDAPMRRRTADSDWARSAATAAQLLSLLRTLPQVQKLCPPPGEATPTTDRPTTVVDDRVLARVRGLLAKAESTEFEAEAEAFTEGAQALMTRHSIDRAMLDHQATDHDAPGALRIGIENPYEQPKALLLAVVAEANQCRSVWSQRLGFSTVVGFAAELAAVESLFTSLLLQATSAMGRQGARRTSRTGSRTRAFRASFLEAYACRIGERLRETAAKETERASAGAGFGAALLPVLAARRQETDSAFEEMFPETTTSSSSRSYDLDGWQAGTAAADLAHISWGSELP